MIWYLILSFLFSLGASLVTIETYYLKKPLKKQCLLFIYIMIIGMFCWPIMLIIDGTIVWNTYLRIKYCNAEETDSESNKEIVPAEETTNNEE